MSLPRSMLLLLLWAALLMTGGCGRRAPADPQARAQAELDQYGAAEALARARDRVQATPTAENFDLLSRVYALLKQRKLAREALEKAVSLDPSYAPSAVLMARLLIAEGKLPPATTILQRIIEQHPNDPEAIELLGRVMLKSGRAAEARTLLAGEVKRLPRALPVIWVYADTLTVLKRYDEAQREYERAIRLDREHVRVRMAYMRMLLFAGKRDEAAVQAREAAKLAPDADDVQLAAAGALRQAGQEGEAIERYREALVINPRNLTAANDFALLLADRGEDTGTAVAWARKAAALAPKNPGVVDTLGWALARDGDLQEGLKALRAAHRALPGDPGVQYHLGWALAKSGQKAEGVRLLQQAAAGRDPDTAARAKQALSEVTRR